MKRSVKMNDESAISNFSNTNPSLQILSNRFFLSTRNSIVKATVATPQGHKLNPELQLDMQLYQVDKKGDLIKAETFEFEPVKVLLVGDINSKKQEVLKQVVPVLFRTNLSKTTIGVDFSTLPLQDFSKIDMTLQVWDIAGQERFGHMTKIYYKDSFFAFVVINANDKTCEASSYWKADLESKKDSMHPQFFSILLVNTHALTDEEFKNFTLEKWEQHAKSEGYAHCFHVDPTREIKMVEAIKCAINKFSGMLEEPVKENITIAKPF